MSAPQNMTITVSSPIFRADDAKRRKLRRPRLTIGAPPNQEQVLITRVVTSTEIAVKRIPCDLRGWY